MYEKIVLPYSYDALEPYIDKETVMIHYNNHYGKYVDKLNEILMKNNYDYRYTKEELVYHVMEFPDEDREDLLFNLGGVLNHELYFRSMSPFGKNYQYDLGILYKKYNDLDKFKNEVIKLGSGIKGSGYIFLCIDNMGEIKLIKLFNQDMPQLYGLIPIMALDVWEHAYYLKYQYRKDEYLNNFFNVINFYNLNK